MIFVSSWDDGHPCDERLAALLDRHGLKGTFYVPLRNREGRDVMSSQQIRKIDATFELGSHTRDHVYLTELSDADCVRQVRDGKNGLEDIVGHAVAGFCYPGGKMNRRVRRTVINAGFSHARTISNLWLSSGDDVFSLHTTAQFYPHPPKVLWRNLLRGGHYFARATAMRVLMSGDDRLGVLRDLVGRCLDTGRVFHIWGHSWEIEKYGLWPQLDSFFSHIASLRPTCMTVSELAERQSTQASARAAR